MRFRLAFLLYCAFLAPLVTVKARAWTDAHVRDAQAKVRLLPAEQRVEVVLDLAVAVRGGWLERLDLTGLEDGLTPAGLDPAQAVLETGERVAAKLVVHGGSVSVRFQRRDGLRRGVHHVLLHYSAPLEHVELRSDGGARVSWVLPGWEAGLSSAAIEISGMRDLRPVHDADVAQDVTSTSEGVRFSRLMVPRTSPWSVAVDLPKEAFQELSVRHGRGVAPARDETRWHTGVLIGLALLALVAVWRLAPRSQERPGPRLVAAWCGLSMLGALCWTVALPVSLTCWSVLCAWGGVRIDAAGRLALGRVVALDRTELKKLQRQRWRERVGSPFGDLATLLGALSVVAVMAAVVRFPSALDLAADPWGLGALCGLFGMLTGSRLWRARSPAEQVALLSRAAARARVVACGLGLNAYLVAGEVREPRLRLTPQARYPGLLRLEVLVDPRRAGQSLWLNAVVEADSAAERWLRALWPMCAREISAGGQRVALLCPTDDVGKIAEQVLEHLGSESQKCLRDSAVTQAA
jgi:hypothetical protein